MRLNPLKIAPISLLIITALVAIESRADPDQQKWAETCTPWDDWDKPAPPFRIHANTYYVGTCGISTLLITGDEGHVLIDGGTEAGGRVVARNIKSLGFEIKDIKILLHSHEHFDHVAGLANLKALSGADVFASPVAAPVLESGVVSGHDPQSGMHEPFPAVAVDKLIESGDSVSLGSYTLNAIATPGHSPGAMSWAWKSCDDQGCIDVVYADSLSPVSSKTYRFGENPAYLKEYKAGLRRLAKLDCDLLLTPHPSASKMVERLKGDGLIGGMNCLDYSEAVLRRLDTRLEREASESRKAQ